MRLGWIFASIVLLVLLAAPAHAAADDLADEFSVVNESNPVTWINRGVDFFNLGQTEDAIEAYDRAIALNSQYSAAWNNKGVALISQGKYDEAIQACDEAIRLYPEYASSWNNKGFALMSQGKYDEAIQAYDEAIRLDSEDATAWNGKGFALMRQGKYDEAIQAYDEAIRLDPEYATTWNNKGSALISQGKYDEAIQTCDEAIRLDPEYATAWNNKGFALINQGKYDEAVQACNEAIRLDPEFALAWNNKGLALYDLGNYDDALISFENALELDSNCVPAWNNKGCALSKLGGYDDALICFEKALEIDPNFVNAWNGKGEALYDLGRYDDALISHENALELDPNCVYAWNDKGNSLCGLGKYDDALICFDKALELDLKYVKAWNGKGAALDGLGRYDGALICFDKALELDPKYLNAWNGKGNALYGLGKYDDALICFENALKLDSKYVNAWNGKGLALYGLGNYDDALICFENALELDPKCVNAWNDKGLALYGLGNYDYALISFEKALELDPNFVYAWNDKGGALYKLGRYDDALVCLEKALEIDPYFVNAWNGKGVAFESLNRSVEAAMAYSLGRESELDSLTRIGIFATFLFVLAAAGYALSKRFRKYPISIIILSVNLLGFLAVMWLLSALFDFMLVGYFWVGGFLMIAISAALWSFSGFPLNPWMKQLVLSIENFEMCRSLRSAMKLAFGSLSIEDFEKSRTFFLPRMVLAFGFLAILAIIPVAGVFYFRFHLGTEISMVHFLEFAFLSIFLVGLFVTLPPILAAMLSKNLDRETRNILLFLQFGHLGISGLYLGLILWIFEIGSFAHQVQLGDIKFPISPQFLGVMMSLFLLAILIPYISGSKRASRWNVTLLEKERSWLEEILDVLDFPTPIHYVPKLQKILDEIKDDETISGQDGEFDRIESLYGAGVLGLDPRFRYRDFLTRQQGRIAEEIDQFIELGDQMEEIKETSRLYAEAYRHRRDEIVSMIEREAQFRPKFWITIAIILTPVLGQVLAILINWILKAMIESNFGGLITSPLVSPLP